LEIFTETMQKTEGRLGAVGWRLTNSCQRWRLPGLSPWAS